ncbi:MAG: DNA topoisomerase III, partial [Syntrophomonadaceae bacterium]|nr:DNA topoisomerase III [Syntrophomonadaceae bacterium]
VRKSDFISDIRHDASKLVEQVRDDAAVYKADNVSKIKCPLCNRYMLLVNGKRGRMLACPDRSCGHRQPEKEDFGRMGSSSRQNQKLIAQYSDKEELGSNLGELLQAALARKQDKKK